MNTKKFNEALEGYLKESYKTLAIALITTKKYEAGMIKIDESTPEGMVEKRKMDNTVELIDKVKAEIELIEKLFEEELVK